MMQRFCFLVLLALSSATAAAAVPQSFHADFTQTRTLPGFDQPLVSRGEVDFERNGSLHWTVTEPYHYEFVMEDGQAREVLPDGTHRNIDSQDAPWLGIIQRVFRAALSGDDNTLTQYFSVRRSDKRLQLTPLAAPLKDHIAQINVVGGDLPDHITITEQGGGEIEIRFSRVTPKPSTP